MNGIKISTLSSQIEIHNDDKILVSQYCVDGKYVSKGMKIGDFISSILSNESFIAGVKDMVLKSISISSDMDKVAEKTNIKGIVEQLQNTNMKLVDGDSEDVSETY